MKTSQLLALFSICGVLTLFGTTGCSSEADSDGDGDAPAATVDKNIIEIATADGMDDVSTLVAAITAAELVETLQGDGPFTVFAPTNAAFEALPEGTVESLLLPENKEKLQGILLYHVHAGAAVMAADVSTTSLETANGQSLSIEVTDAGVTVDGAKVIKTDLVASNGVIHLIDAVVLPSE
ncbi:MAG: fasciclin domain-containing protein [Planctomycetota bacterium]